MTAVTFEATDEQRRTVRAMAGFGLPHKDIAVLINGDMETLRGHFLSELERGAAEGTAWVAQTLFQMATVDKNVSAVIFWMKARAGWREKQDIELPGKDGKPLRPTVVTYRWAKPEPCDPVTLEHELAPVGETG